MPKERFTSLKDLVPKKKVSFSKKLENFEDEREMGSKNDCMSIKSVVILSGVSLLALMLPSGLLRTSNDTHKIIIRVAIIALLYHIIMCKKIPFVKISF
jgi:hypothetical protein